MANITASMVKELREITGAAMMDCKRALTEASGDFEIAKEILRKKGQAIADKKSSRETKEGRIAIYLGEEKASMVKVACETDFVAINEKFKNFIDEIASQVATTGADSYKKQIDTEGTKTKEFFVSTIAGLGENIVYLDGIDCQQSETNVVSGYVHTTGKIGVLVDLETTAGSDRVAISALGKDIAMHIAASQVEAISSADLDPAVVEKEKAFLIDQAKDSGKPEAIVEKMVMGRLQKYKKEICLLEQKFIKSPDITVSQLLDNSTKELGCEIKVKQFFKFTF
jgi:elongation factor Ts